MKGARKRSSGAGALELLARDHREVEGLFAEFERMGTRGKRGRAALAKQIVAQLALHSAIEEQVLYRFVRTVAPELRDEILKALEEHHVVKRTLNEIQGLGADDEHLVPKVLVLAENVRHHVDEEESDFFPRLRQSLSEEDLERLRVMLERAKEAYSGARTTRRAVATPAAAGARGRRGKKTRAA